VNDSQVKAIIRLLPNEHDDPRLALYSYRFITSGATIHNALKHDRTRLDGTNYTDFTIWLRDDNDPTVRLTIDGQSSAIKRTIHDLFMPVLAVLNQEAMRQ
jgi:hypothetical protein